MKKLKDNQELYGRKEKNRIEQIITRRRKNAMYPYKVRQRKKRKWLLKHRLEFTNDRILYQKDIKDYGYLKTNKNI